jgi:hypothetical protein
MKKKYLLIFNKISGEYAGQFDYKKDLEKRIDKNLVKGKVVEMTDGEVWKGNFDTGKVVKPDPNTVVVFEEEMDMLAGKKIEAKYPLFKQINILAGLLDLMSESVDKNDPRYVAFEEMKGYVDRTKANNERYIESAKQAEDREFISKADQREAESRRLDGPLRSIVGRV